MSVPLLGRNARLFKDGVVIGYGKNISVKASAELIKEYSMDSLTPAIVAPGKESFKWSAEKTLRQRRVHGTPILNRWYSP